MILVDLGADVIKVQDTGRRDTRGMGGPRSKARTPPTTTPSTANKRSLAVDLKSDDGKTLVGRLAQVVDLLRHQTDSLRNDLVARLAEADASN